ncbi:hypothetical protein DY000_02034337 [Brassica cretica]|uniref:Uncharacterized protein n=1 Tax=Brassica cretica TaxID=69181 RepID=A0ABQ7DIC1_BRACR|nr:hypothetical protein DY000_02034337 [Brassica cretica]
MTSLGSYPDSFSFPDMPSLLRFQDLAPTNVHQQIKSCFNDHVLLSNPEEETCLKDPC